MSGLGTSPVYNPSRGDVISEVPMCGADVVNDAVTAAADAFPASRETPPVERARLFFRYRHLVEQNFDRICHLVGREHGKTLAEARGSAYRGLANEYGPVITAQHRDRVVNSVASGEQEGAKILCDGRDARSADAPHGCFLGATIVDQVQRKYPRAQGGLPTRPERDAPGRSRSRDRLVEHILLRQRHRHFHQLR